MELETKRRQGYTLTSHKIEQAKSGKKRQKGHYILVKE